MEDKCISCGAIIPEGRQVCPRCEKGKFTDDEVIKALECCVEGTSEACFKCMFGLTPPYPVCKTMIEKYALDLINRQRAEIERLKKDNEYILMQHAFQRRPSGDCWNDVIEKAKAEAIKEFCKERGIEYVENDIRKI